MSNSSSPGLIEPYCHGTGADEGGGERMRSAPHQSGEISAVNSSKTCRMTLGTSTASAGVFEIVPSKGVDVGVDARQLAGVGKKDNAEGSLFGRHAKAGSVDTQDAGGPQ